MACKSDMLPQYTHIFHIHTNMHTMKNAGNLRMKNQGHADKNDTKDQGNSYVFYSKLHVAEFGLVCVSEGESAGGWWQDSWWYCPRGGGVDSWLVIAACCN